MTAPPEDRFAFVTLARQGSRIERRLGSNALPRLAELAPGIGPVTVDLEFRVDGTGRAWVRGSAEQRVEAGCQRCLERFERQLRVEFDLCIVREDAAGEIAAEVVGATTDVLVAGSETLSIADIVEDEMLLGLPERQCLEEPCPFAPGLSYPAAGSDAVGERAEAAGPFGILAKLKRADS